MSNKIMKRKRENKEKMMVMELYLLYCSKLYLCHGILDNEEEQESVMNIIMEKFNKVVNVMAFDPINNITNQILAFSPAGNMTDELHNLLTLALPKDDCNVLDLIDPKFDSHIFEVTHIPYETSKIVVELFRDHMNLHIDMITGPDDPFLGTHASNSRDWSNIVTDILECVVEKLSCFDIIRFKHVCHAWKFAVENMSVAPSCSSHLPLLMLTTSDGKGCCFFNLVTHKIHREFNNMWRGIENIIVIGCSKGWLTLLVRKDFKSHHVYIFNPSAIQLRKIVIPSNAPLDFDIDDNILEIFLTFDPMHYGDKFEVLIQYKDQRLAVLTQHDQNHEKDEWFSHSIPYTYLDMRCSRHWIFNLRSPRVLRFWRPDWSNSRGGLYLMRRKLKIHAPDDTLSLLAGWKSKRGEALILGDKGYKVKHYILEYSEHSIIFVMRLMYQETAAAIPQTKSFVVLSLCLKRKRWSRLRSLRDLVLFIGRSECLSLISNSYTHKNSIYFADCEFGGDTGVFSLENGSIKYFLPDEIKKNIQRAVWYI